MIRQSQTFAFAVSTDSQVYVSIRNKAFEYQNDRLLFFYQNGKKYVSMRLKLAKKMKTHLCVKEIRRHGTDS